jgi:MFS family permease
MTDSTQAVEETPEIATSKFGKFKSNLGVFAIQGYPWLLLANASAFVGFNIRNMGQAWLVLDLTDSAFLVGLVNAMPAMALLILSPLGGLFADRFNRRTVALRGRFFVALNSFLVAYLVSTGNAEVWHLLITGFLLGIAFALSNPSTQTIVMDIVGRDRMVSAQSLNTSVSNIGTLVGPAIGGILIAKYGVSAIFWMVAVVYGIGWLGFFGVPGKEPDSDISEAGWGSAFTQMGEGLRYAFGTPKIRWMLFSLTGVLYWGAIQPLIPVFARDVLGVGASGFGYMNAAWGGGALVSAIVIFAIGNVPRKGLVITISTLLLAGSNSLFALSTNYPVSLAILAFSGAAGGVWITVTFTLIQTSVSDEMRGRVMGLGMSALMMMGFGFMLGGVLADTIGPKPALHASAIMWIVWALIAFWRSPELRQAD